MAVNDRGTIISVCVIDGYQRAFISEALTHSLVIFPSDGVSYIRLPNNEVVFIQVYVCTYKLGGVIPEAIIDSLVSWGGVTEIRVPSIGDS